jgi:RNA polymerase sigma factor (sigma-70 family)
VVDPSLISSVKKREQAAFKQMYESCIAYVYAIVRRYITDESYYQDIIQEIFARLFLSIDTFDPQRGEFKYWLRRMVINQCFQHQRQNRCRGRLVSLDKIQAKHASYEIHFPNFSEEELAVYLQSMPKGYREVFLLVVIDEYSHQEAAKLLGITPGTSRSQLLRAKQWLSRKIDNINPKIAAANGH